MILINLLPHREAAKKRRKEAFQVNMVMAAIAGLLIAGLIYWYFQIMIEGQQNKNNLLRSEIKVLETQIKEIDGLESGQRSAVWARGCARPNTGRRYPWARRACAR